MQVDSILAGKYRLVSQIGRGGMGSVWKAEHLELCAPVAIKLMDPTLAAGLEAARRFLGEARAAAALRSPHVVQILDYGVDDATEIPFIAMELMEGESLAARLNQMQRLAPAEAARVVTHVARALTRAHEAGIVHRDLKPENIFLVRNEDEEIAKVLDFGIAKSTSLMLAGHPATQSGSVLGTPFYMSPEQISGSRQIDFRTDLWALAVIAYECLTGRRPFQGGTVGGLALQICTRRPPLASSFAVVPKDFDAWFDRATDREPARRYGSARELADDFRRVCGTEVVRVATVSDGASGGASTQSPSLGEGIQALSHTTPQYVGVPAGRWPLRIGFAAVLVGVALASTSLLERAEPSAASSGSTTPPAPSSVVATTAGLLPDRPMETPHAAPPPEALPAKPDAAALRASDAVDFSSHLPARPAVGVDSSKRAPPPRLDAPRSTRVPAPDRTAPEPATASSKAAAAASAVPTPPSDTDADDDTEVMLEDRK
jgi:serine/threonine-protein kinase